MSDYLLYGSYKSFEASVGTSTTVEFCDFSSTGTASPTPLKRSEHTVIRTDQTITVKFESTANDGITITSAMSPFTLEKLIIKKVFVTTGGSAAAVKILGFGPLLYVAT